MKQEGYFRQSMVPNEQVWISEGGGWRLYSLNHFGCIQLGPSWTTLKMSEAFALSGEEGAGEARALYRDLPF